MKSRTNSTPLQILDKEMLHQIPSNPKGVEDNNIAAGIRAAVSRILTREGVRVWPKPEYAPLVTLSQHMNS